MYSLQVGISHYVYAWKCAIFFLATFISLQLSYLEPYTIGNFRRSSGWAGYGHFVRDGFPYRQAKTVYHAATAIPRPDMPIWDRPPPLPSRKGRTENSGGHPYCGSSLRPCLKKRKRNGETRTRGNRHGYFTVSPSFRTKRVVDAKPRSAT